MKQADGDYLVLLKCENKHGGNLAELNQDYFRQDKGDEFFD